MEPMTLGSPVGSPVQTPGTPGTNSAYLPSFLLGETNTPARLGMMNVAESPRYVNTGSANLPSPISSYGTPDYRHNRQKAMFANATSPSGGQMGSEGHTGGPPTRGLFDALEISQTSPNSYGTPNNRSIAPHNQSSRLLTNNVNNSIFLDNPVNLTPNEPSQGLLQWVTVFGFPPNAINTVLSHISNRVRIVDKHPPPHPQSNWIHLKCATEQEAQRALACNGNVVSGAIMIGVTPCMDEGVVLSPDKENRAKFNGSMRIFTSPGKANQGTSGDPGSSMRSPGRIQNARPLATGYNQHLSPQAVRAAENVPQRSTGLVSKAMEFVFGWELPEILAARCGRPVGFKMLGHSPLATINISALKLYVQLRMFPRGPPVSSPKPWNLFLAANQGTSGDPGSSMRSPGRIQNARPLATGYNQHLSPQAVRAAENVPQRSTGLVSKAMEFVFGW